MPASRPINDLQILIADDDRDGADVLSALVQLELGCRVVMAYDGEQALQLALAVQPDVLLLDLQMPGLSGLEVAARAASARDGATRPLILAMTGRRDLARDLAVLDMRFDRAFAKPVDHATLFSTLRAHWSGEVVVKAPVRFKFFDTFTQAARDVMPLLAARGQQISFDGEGPELTLDGDEPGMHAALYRLMCGALDLVGSGIVLFTARSAATDGGCVLTVNLACSGRPEPPERIEEVLQRLALVNETGDPVPAPGPAGAAAGLRARGVCPNTGGIVSCAGRSGEGMLLRLELGLPQVEFEAAPHAQGARAWLIDRRDIAPAVLERRLQRLGWRVWRFDSATDAAKHRMALAAADLPDLLLVHDETAASRAAALALRSRMPSRTRCMLLVGTGGAALSHPHLAEGCDMWVEPLSPADLAHATALALDPSRTAAGPMTTSHGLQGRRKVLVVDDHEVNRFVATGLLEALGYEVASVTDGLDAIEYCKQAPPDAVLMDINMRVLDGIDASRRLFELQRLGRVAPFAIVAATADDAPETRARCFEAGVRGYLYKPLRLELMRDELRRVGVPATGNLRN